MVVFFIILFTATAALHFRFVKTELHAQHSQTVSCLMAARATVNHPARSYGCTEKQDNSSMEALCDEMIRRGRTNPLSTYVKSDAKCRSLGFPATGMQNKFSVTYYCLVDGYPYRCSDSLIQKMKNKIGY